MRLALVGTSHHVAPVGVRERYSLPGGLARELLCAMRADGAAEEALVIDTCNRTEVYLAASGDVDEREYVAGHLRRLKGLSDDDMSSLYAKSDLEAVRHLFRVVCSLDSQVVGEYQILRQAKDAYSLAVEVGVNGFFTDRLMHAAFAAAKRVLSETQLGRDSVSVPHAAVDLARRVFSSLEGRTVLLIGAGETAHLAARALMRHGVSRIVVANRTLSRAREVGEELLSRRDEASAGKGGGSARRGHDRWGTTPGSMERPLDPADPCRTLAGGRAPEVSAITIEDVPAALAGVDLVISSTGAPGAVLTMETAGAVLKDRERPLIVIDIAVPRDVEERIGGVANVFLHNIEDLNRIVAENSERRRLEIPKAEAIVEEEAARFAAWQKSLALAPTIRLLVRRFEELRRDEVRRYGGAAAGGDIERFAEALCNKILHGPLSYLRETAEKGTESERMAAVELIRRMFDLDGSQEP
jgi:glutamyl-tRNA reductase